MRLRILPVLAGGLLLALGVTGCFNPFRPLVSGLTSHVEAPPVPSGPREVVQLFRWCWENRDISRYREIFTDDYRFAFAIGDSAGNPYTEAAPWTRDDELISAQNLFIGGGSSGEAASSISLIFDGDLNATSDSRNSPSSIYDPRYHKQVYIPHLTLTITTTGGSGLQVTGAATFFLVRGDSAAIPDELEQRGFGPDSTRWYILRWEDQTNVGPGGSALRPALPGSASRPPAWPGATRSPAIAGLPAPAAGAAASPAATAEVPKPITWGMLKLVYRQP